MHAVMDHCSGPAAVRGPDEQRDQQSVPSARLPADGAGGGHHQTRAAHAQAQEARGRQQGL